MGESGFWSAGWRVEGLSRQDAGFRRVQKALGAVPEPPQRRGGSGNAYHRNIFLSGQNMHFDGNGGMIYSNKHPYLSV